MPGNFMKFKLEASAETCTQQLQSAIDSCHAGGGGFVTLPPGAYEIGTIHLKSHVHLVLDPGAELLGSRNIADYDPAVIGCIEAPSFSRCLIYAENASNIGLHGPGMIDGRGTKDVFKPSDDPDQVPERPMLIRFVDCRDVRMRGVTLKNAASWCCHLVGCEKVWIEDTTIDSRVNVNNDGFDLDSCRDVFIRGCHLFTGDDSICPKSTRDYPCENIIVSDCLISSETAGVKLGTSSAGGFRNVLVKNCIFRDCRMGVLKLLCVDGGVLENVHFSDLIMENVEGPIFIRLGARNVVFDRPKEIVYDRDDVKDQLPEVRGILRNCSFRNIRATVRTDDPARSGIMVTGVPGNCIENVTFENVDIIFPGGGTTEDAARAVPEDERRYPEQFFFGVLPCSAVFLRHVCGVSLRHISFTWENADLRPWIVSHDAEELAVAQCRGRVGSTQPFRPVSLTGSEQGYGRRGAITT
jgi:polygalacturonase